MLAAQQQVPSQGANNNSSALKQHRKQLRRRESTVFSKDFAETLDLHKRKLELHGWNIAKNLNLVKNFIQKLKYYSSFQSFTQVSRQHLDIINDLSYVPQSQRKEISSRLALVFICLLDFLQKRILERIKVILPDNLLVIIFKICTYLLILQQVAVIPL